jgi:N-methylhydantoinase B/oxoprolinase/acetone carboxylase alpha subunit
MSETDNALISGARYFISDGDRTLELKHIISHTANDGNSAEVQTNANGEVIGKTRTGGGYTLNLKVRSTQKRREVAWKRMQKNQVNFRFDVQQSKHKRDQYIKCWVSNVAESGGNGDYSLDVTIVSEGVEPIDL